MPFIISVEGVISTGKSTLISQCLVPILTEMGYKVKVIPEPVDKWVESGLLQKFYDDPHRWGYSFQTSVFHDRITEVIKVYNEEPKADIYIMERSCASDKIFMKVLKQDGIVSDLEYALYQNWADLWTQLMPALPDLVVFLRTEVGICMNRLKRRNREGEEGVSMDYQSKLLTNHDLMFGGRTVTMGSKNVPCITINGDQDFISDRTVQLEIVNKIGGNLKAPPVLP